MDNRCGYETKWDEMRCKRGVRRSRNKKFEWFIYSNFYFMIPIVGACFEKFPIYKMKSRF
jgi:hypothetical protein